ncbi:MAG: hypothetical protein ACRDKT_15175 [Actinomycetota bacterium]
MEQLEVFEEPQHEWRWRYTDGNGTAVLSNHSYDDPLEAMLAARSAYPDLEVVGELDELEAAPPVPDKKDIFVLIVAVLVALGVIWWRRRTDDITEDVS